MRVLLCSQVVADAFVLVGCPEVAGSVPTGGGNGSAAEG